MHPPYGLNLAPSDFFLFLSISNDISNFASREAFENQMFQFLVCFPNKKGKTKRSIFGPKLSFKFRAKPTDFLLPHYNCIGVCALSP